METITDYFNDLLLIIKKNCWVIDHEINFRQIDSQEGYIKGTLFLYGGFILHISEYTKIESNQIFIDKYRYQLQDKDSNLIIRWDNAPHHNEISTYPSHKHLKDGKVLESGMMDIKKLLFEINNILK